MDTKGKEDEISLLNQHDAEIDIDDSQENRTFSIPHNKNIILPQPTPTTNVKTESSTSTIITVISFYFIISISLVFLNKILMADLKFEYPLFITWYQQIVSFVAIYIMSSISPYFPSLSFLPPFEFKTATASKVLPLTVVLTCMIIFNNLCLEYVEVSFYQVARSLTICFSLLLTYVILKTKTSSKATLACGIVFFGFLLGSIGEVNFSWLGIIFGLFSSFFVALYSIYVKRVLPVCDGNEWKLSIYNTALSIIIIMPLIFISGEGSTIFEQEVFYTSKFWIYMTIAGVFGYLISISIFMQIKHTSPLTNTISGTVKACVQTILAVMVWNNPISFENFIGIVLVIGGSFWYSYVRYMEMKK
ncbi:GDP-fucose transporter 1 [Tieghemostelium lacteum]|uniref:GDP-fucose transporter 1 n=1 Tax=Tieghemostelium lacteum TaxID=361077 RepID=A0A152A3J7_TIELA|nr:GDP-fucose transporter 1 [Tieghemostelium lacteum]|eukprot:KYR00621.1 GDP-fucose transporter 1 [Tieghemostelium lacteum]